MDTATRTNRHTTWRTTMQGLGKKLGEGATAEVYEFGEGTVIKVVKPTISASIIDYEAWVTRTVSEAGALTPIVGELVDIEGRHGFVMERVDSRPPVDLLLAGEMAPEACGRILAELSCGLHGVSASATSVRTFHDFAGPMLDGLEERGCPGPLLAEGRRILSSLDAGDAMVHGDMNPNNVLMTADGLRFIGWISAMRGNPMVDLARIAVAFSVVLISEWFHPGLTTEAFWDVRRGLLSANLETYAALAGTWPEVLAADLVPWMTVMATLAVAEGTPDQQAWIVSYLQQRIADAWRGGPSFVLVWRCGGRGRGVALCDLHGGNTKGGGQRCSGGGRRGEVRGDGGGDSLSGLAGVAWPRLPITMRSHRPAVS